MFHFPEHFLFLKRQKTKTGKLPKILILQGKSRKWKKVKENLLKAETGTGRKSRKRKAAFLGGKKGKGKRKGIRKIREEDETGRKKTEKGKAILRGTKGRFLVGR